MKPSQLYEAFRENGLTFFSGVPDSTLEHWISHIEKRKDAQKVIATNEGEAVSICAGYHIATGKTGVVYMQNSGEGNIVNPMTSLCDQAVYSIPVLLMIGWRGMPEGKKDEPQHAKMGKVTLDLLVKVLGIPYSIIHDDLEDAKRKVAEAKKYMDANSSPYALVFVPGVFEREENMTDDDTGLEMNREDAIITIADNMKRNDIIVSTTGKTSRELFEYRKRKGQGNDSDFLTVGSMGYASSIALGIAMQKKDRNVFIFDGDGAALMHMGNLGTIGHYGPKNLKHIIFDNRAYDSTGGQKSISGTVNFGQIAIECGYKFAFSSGNKDLLESRFNLLKECNGPSILVVKVRKGARADLGRPDTTPVQNKEALMKNLGVVRSEK